MLKTVALIFAAISVVGCSTVPVEYLKPKNTNTPMLTIAVDTGAHWGPCTVLVLVDDKKIGVVNGGTVNHFPIALGKRKVTGWLGGDQIFNPICMNKQLTHIVHVDGDGVVFRAGIASSDQFIFDQVE